MRVELKEEKMVNGDYIVGKHVYGSLYGIEPSVAEDEKLIREAVLDAVKAANSTLIQIMSWKVPGIKGGVSVMALVNESHIVVHAWTEYRYATVDVYTCGAHTRPDKAFELIVRRLKPKYYSYNYADRSQIATGKEIEMAEKATP